MSPFGNHPTTFGEKLQTVHDTGGATHAVYPTATLTLCGLSRASTKASLKSDTPSCGLCATAAREFRRIDRSAPAHWFVPLEAAL